MTQVHGKDNTVYRWIQDIKNWNNNIYDALFHGIYVAHERRLTNSKFAWNASREYKH